MAAKKRLSKADAAYLKNVAQMEGRTPVPPGVLPGQIDMLDGSIAGSTAYVEAYAPVATPPHREPAEHEHIPEACPECHRRMMIESGWALVKPREDRKLQCGNCGLVILVPQGAYDTLALAIKAYFDRLNYVPPKPDKGAKRTRGAG